MAAVSHDITIWRRDPMRFTFAAVGVDASGAGATLAVRLYADTPGPPLLLLVPTATMGVEGVRAVQVTRDADGIPTTIFEALALKEKIAALPFAGELGSDLSLAYDMQWTLPPDGLFTQVEETFMFGRFIVKGSVND